MFIILKIVCVRKKTNSIDLLFRRAQEGRTERKPLLVGRLDPVNKHLDRGRQNIRVLQVISGIQVRSTFENVQKTDENYVEHVERQVEQEGLAVSCKSDTRP